MPFIEKKNNQKLEEGKDTIQFLEMNISVQTYIWLLIRNLSKIINLSSYKVYIVFRSLQLGPNF